MLDLTLCGTLLTNLAMNLRHVVTLGLIGAVFVLAGCEKGREDPGEVAVRVVNAAPSFAQLVYRREREQSATLAFKGSTPQLVYDIDSYDFYVAETLLTPGTPRTWTFARQLEAEHSYVFAITEALGAAQTVVIDQSAPPATDARIYGLNAGENLPALDLYLERPGVGIAGATPRGTFAAGQQLTPVTVPSGDYEVFITAAGNPANVLLASTTVVVSAGSNQTFVVVPEPAAGANAISLIAMQPAANTTFYDRNATSSLRVINGAADTVPRDFALASQFSPPLFSAIPFADPTAFATTPVAGAQTINVTPVGDPGVLELSASYAGIPLQRATLLFGGAAGTLTHVLTFDDNRRIANEAKLLLLNAANQFTTGLDFLLVQPGADPGPLLADASLAAPGSTLAYIPLAPGEFDLYLRVPGTTTYASGPTRLSVAGGGIYGVLAVNGPDTATASLVLFDDFP